jgi:hypothetical protein
MAARQSEFIPPASPAPSEKPGARKTSWDSAIFAGFPGRKATNYQKSKRTLHFNGLYLVRCEDRYRSGPGSAGEPRRLTIQ